MNVDAVAHLEIDIVMFDGYVVSTKDFRHVKRTGKMSNIEIRDDLLCPSDRELFFTNKERKVYLQTMISELAKKL